MSTLHDDGTPHQARSIPSADGTERIPPDSVPGQETLGHPGTNSGTIANEVPADLRDHERYRLLELLGKGGMGLVFKAEHRLMDRIVALKVIHQHLLSSVSTVERFQREVQAAARLEHPNIVAAYDADQAGATHFLVMEFVQGQTLSEVLAQRGKLGIQQACDVARQVALGLEHAHTLGMIHRDVKPDNLMLTPAGEVKILDFGLARLGRSQPLDEAATEAATPDETSSPLTQAGTVMGTPDYLAPEQASDSHGVDVRADVYALGCTLYQLLSGRVPHPGGSTADKLRRHLTQEPTALRTLRPEVPAELAAVVQRMMARDPAARFQTPAEVVAALTPFALPRRPRRWAWVVGLAAPLLLALGALAYWLPRSDREPGTLVVDSAEEVVLLARRAGAADVVLQVGLQKSRFALPAGSYSLVFQEDRPDWRLVPAEVEIQPGESTRAEVVSLGEGLTRRWPIVPLPDPLTLVSRHNAADGLPPFRVPAEVAEPLSLPPGIELAAVLGEGRLSFLGLYGFPGFSGDGKTLAIPDGPNVLFRDVQTGRRLRVLRAHRHPVTTAVLSPDGKWLGTSARNGDAALWDLRTGEKVRAWKFEGFCWDVAFCPKSRLLLLPALDGTLVLHDVITDRQVVKSSLPNSLRGVAFHPTAPLVAMANARGGVGFVDTTGKRAGGVRPEEIPPPERAESIFHLVAFDPKGERLAIGTDDRIRVGIFRPDPPTWKELWSTGVGGSGLLAFTPDGKQLLGIRHYLAGGKAARYLVALDAVTGKQLSKHQLPGRGEWGCYRLGPDGRLVAGGPVDSRQFTLFDRTRGRSNIQATGHEVQALALAFSPDGRFLVSGARDDHVRVWDLATGRSRDPWTHHNSWVTGLAFSPDGTLLASCGFDRTVQVMAFPSGKILRVFALPSGVRKVVFAADGKQVHSCADDGKVRSHDLATGASTDRFDTTSKVFSLASDAGGEILAAGTLRGLIHLWDLPAGKQTHILGGHERGKATGNATVVCLARSPDNRWLYSTGDDGTVRIWNFADGTLAHTLRGLASDGYAVAASPDGRLLAAGGKGGNLQVWDLTRVRKGLPPSGAAPSGRERPLSDFLARPPSHHVLRPYQPGQVTTGTAFSPEGRYLATALSDGTIQLFRLARRGKVPELPATSVVLTEVGTFAQGGGPHDLAILPNGKEVVSIDGRGLLRHWRLADRRELSTAFRVGTLPTNLAPTPDGRSVWVLSEGGKLTCWDIARGIASAAVTGMGSWTLASDRTGRLLTSGAAGEIRLLDRDGKELWRERLDPGGARVDRALALSRDGRRALVGREGNQVEVWDLEKRTKTSSHRFRSPQAGSSGGLGITSDGTFGAWRLDDDQVRIHDLVADRPVATVSYPGLRVRGVAFSPDARTLALAGEGGILALVDVATGKPLDVAILPGLLPVVFSADGKRLVVGQYADGVIRVYRIGS